MLVTETPVQNTDDPPYNLNTNTTPKQMKIIVRAVQFQGWGCRLNVYKTVGKVENGGVIY